MRTTFRIAKELDIPVYKYHISARYVTNHPSNIQNKDTTIIFTSLGVTLPVDSEDLNRFTLVIH